MKKYLVEVLETLCRVTEIEADSEDDALEIADEMYRNGDIILDYSDCAGVDFSSGGVQNETEN